MEKLPMIPISSIRNPYLRAFMACMADSEQSSKMEEIIAKIARNAIKNPVVDVERPSSNLTLTHEGTEIDPQMIRAFRDSLVASDETIDILDKAKVDVCNSNLDVDTKINSLIGIFNNCIAGAYETYSNGKYLELAKESIISAYFIVQGITSKKERMEYLIDLLGALPCLIEICIHVKQDEINDYLEHGINYLNEAEKAVNELPESKNLSGNVDTLCEGERDHYKDAIEVIRRRVNEKLWFQCNTGLLSNHQKIEK